MPYRTLTPGQRRKNRRISQACAIIMAASLVLLTVSISFAASRFSMRGQDLTQIAQELAGRNFDCLYYFRLSHLPATQKPYDAAKLPLGYTPCGDDPFSSYDQLEEFVKSTFTGITAETLLQSKIWVQNGKGELYQIPRYQEAAGMLCMAPIQTVTDYHKDLTSLKVRVSQVQRDHARVEVTVHAADGREEVLSTQMVLRDGEWLLLEMMQ